MKLLKNKKYLQRKLSQKVLVPQTTVDFTSRVSKSYVPFTCKFPMVMHFVPIRHKRCRSKTNFYVFIYDKTSLKFCASFRIFIAVFIEKFQTIHYLNYVRRGIVHNIWWRLSINKRASTFGIIGPFDKPFQLALYRDIDLDLWSTSRSNWLLHEWSQFSEFACFHCLLDDQVIK